MTSVFVAGSRRLGRLNLRVQARLSNIIEGSYRVCVGDANGADKAVQSFLSERKYANVTVFCSGHKCRNNVGQWQTFNVDVPAGVTGKAFYTVKDIEMAEQADYGLMLWDGKSAGTISNVVELVKRRKKTLVYLSQTQEFIPVSSLEGIEKLLTHCQPKDVAAMKGKAQLGAKIKELEELNQGVLSF